MDVITAAIDSVRFGRANARRITESGAWGVRFPPIAVLGFHVLLRGEGWLITADDAPAALRPGDMIFTAALTEHGLAHAPCRLEELPEFGFDHVPEPEGTADFEFLCGAYTLDGRPPALLQRLPGVVALSPDHDRNPGLRALVDMLSADFAAPAPEGPEAGRAALVDLMIVHALRHLQEQGWVIGAEPGIAEALHAIHERPERPWTVQQLSAVAGMSRTSFARRFTAAVGAPPMAYLTDWRLSTGARLLRQTPTPLAGIARRVGYASEFGFAAAFRRRYGIAPGRFRARG
ncbi:AraC family transcriptional regulator [Pseudonocardia humida]|uniref:AraC family transcriptional regulator n=1 Tax=Pseudonocardia humida TaxID=2800819 RepID=A0ABT1A0P7_9PSEU|nr:AraC family transcriptional regulator [Pseudonocardia humida]MCO1656480.1 AraC family transcriptional regulator [Pseudonocardia humida]